MANIHEARFAGTGDAGSLRSVQSECHDDVTVRTRRHLDRVLRGPKRSRIGIGDGPRLTSGVGVCVVTPPLVAISVITSPEPIWELVAFGFRLNSPFPYGSALVPSSPVGTPGTTSREKSWRTCMSAPSVKPRTTRNEVFVEFQRRKTWRSRSCDTRAFPYDQTVTVLHESQ